MIVLSTDTGRRITPTNKKKTLTAEKLIISMNTMIFLLFHWLFCHLEWRQALSCNILTNKQNNNKKKTTHVVS